MKQYGPNKLTKWGFKVWSLADSINGYVCAIDIYTGKRAQPTRNGLGYDVVMKLIEDFTHRHHHVYFDSYFSSIKLLDDLQKVGTYACATVRANRAGLPDAVKKPRNLVRGQSVMRQRGNHLAVVWQDKKEVRVISTNSQPTDGTVNRRAGKVMQETVCPDMIINYNSYMGGVDLADQNRSYYSIGRDAKKFWKCLCWYLIDTCIVNSYMLYKEALTAQGRTVPRHLAYRLKLIEQLIAGFSSRKRAGRHGPDSTVMEESQLSGHSLTRGPKRVCRNCSQVGNKTATGRAVQSSYQCQLCNVTLCQGGCLVAFHTRHSTTG